MLRTFLRPGWIVLGIVVVAFAALCFWILAPWQLGKNSATEQRNDLIRSAVATAVVPVDDVMPPGRAFAPDVEWREVSIEGRYAPTDVLVRLRSAGERPATEILTPFTTVDGSRTFLVDRGYVRPEQSSAAADIAPAPTDVVTIKARIRKGEGTSPGRGAHFADGHHAVYTIDPAAVGPAVGTQFDDFYLQLSGGQPGGLGEIALPQLDSGPYLSYGLQWLAFGVMAPLGALYFIVTEVKHRRAKRAVDEGADVAASGVRDSPLRDAGLITDSTARTHIGAAPELDTTSDAVREKLAKRYGQ